MTHKLGHLALLAAFPAVAASSAAGAATVSISLSGDPSQFVYSQQMGGGATYDEYYLPLTGLGSGNAVAVSQGDTVDATVTLSSIYVIPPSTSSTYLLQYLTGSGFPAENTGVTGTFTFYDLGVPVKSVGYSSTTSGQLSSFAVETPPNNGLLPFDSFTNDFTINTLATPATLDGSGFQYDLVTNGVPEPATWGLMVIGFGLAGALTRHRRRYASAIERRSGLSLSAGDPAVDHAVEHL